MASTLRVVTAVHGVDARRRVAHSEPGVVCDDLKGSFGFEQGERHEGHEVAIASGERIPLPAVRGATEDTLVITKGSGKEQIHQQTDREASHLAEVLAPAQGGRDGGPFRSRPERLVPHTAAFPWHGAAIAAAAGIGLAGVVRARRAVR